MSSLYFTRQRVDNLAWPKKYQKSQGKREAPPLCRASPSIYDTAYFLLFDTLRDTIINARHGVGVLKLTQFHQTLNSRFKSAEIQAIVF